MSAVVSKKLKFKGEKSKKKKRSHKEVEGEDTIEESGDPNGWIFPADVLEISGPSYILLPSNPPTCLAYEPTRQRVFAAPLTLPVAPEGEDELSFNEIIEVVEPTDVNHVWVISRLSGSEDVISLRTSSGTFLTAASSGALSASTPSRGPLEGFVPILSTGTTLHPSFSLKTSSDKYLSISVNAEKLTLGKPQVELRADAEEIAKFEGLRIKCQRDFVNKARAELAGGPKGKKRNTENGRTVDIEGTVDDERERNAKFQAWNLGKSVVSDADRRGLSKAKKDGRLSEAMLDRRQKLKHDKYC